MAELITTPTFSFDQAEAGNIHVEYYSESVLLKQGNDIVEIDYKSLNSFLKEIKRHLPEALKYLK
jgi:hypothetical protein